MYKNYYHYTVGNKETLDKLQAIYYASEENEWIHFHMPQWLQDLPTHIEPEESLKTLCIRRAKQLRDTNNYLKLWFSGGCDSTYMLKTFVDNNIHVDEIISVKSGIPEADWEIDKIAVPFLDKIKPKIPNTKVTIQTPTINDYKEFYKDAYWFEKYTKLGRASKGFMGLRLNEYFESINYQDYKPGTANILGLDKPLINFVNREWYTFFLDISVEFQLGNTDNRHHCFFNDDPLIYTKQCHLLKNSIVRNLQPIEYNKVCAGDKKYQTLWNTSIERIKPNENFIVKSFEAVGAEYQAINHKESIGQKSMSKNFPDIYKNYLNGLKNLESIQKGKWFNKQTAKLGSLGIFSDFKSLDTNNTKTVDQLFPNGYKT